MSERPKSSPAVIDGRIVRLSASSVEKFDDTTPFGCERKWYFSYVLGLKEPTMASQELGSAVHSQIEHYLGTGQEGFDKRVLPGLAFVRPLRALPAGTLEVEKPLADGLLTSHGIPFSGFIDIRNASGSFINSAGASESEESAIVEILDWKTTSSISNYAKTPEELAENIQVTAYAKHELLRSGVGLDGVRVSHVYFQTKGAAKAAKVTVRLSRQAVESSWSKVERLVEKMNHAVTMQDVGQLPRAADPRKCDRCPFAFQCITNTAVQTPGKSMSLLNQLNAIIGEKPSPQGAEVVTPVNNPTASPASTADIRTTPAATVVQAAVQTPTTVRLFVNCLPLSGNVKALESYVSARAQSIAVAASVSDIRLAPGTPLAFGAWKGALAAAVKMSPPEAGDYYATTGDMSDVVVEALKSILPAENVFVGVR